MEKAKAHLLTFVRWDHDETTLWENYNWYCEQQARRDYRASF